MIRNRIQIRRGAVAVESAIVLPIVIVVVIAIASGAYAVFTYEQIASLAREASRYASVHGQYHAQDTGTTATTATKIYQNAILPRVVNIDPTKLTYSVSWNPDQKQNSYVTVTVTYTTSVPIFGNLTMKSTSCSPISW
jgi:Flp pilus assembly protein TadG